MPVETPEDRRSLVSSDDFGQSVKITPAAGGPSLTVDGILDVPFQGVDVDGVEIGDAAYTITFASDDVPGLEIGDKIEIVGGATFLVHRIRPQEDGAMVEVDLRES